MNYIQNITDTNKFDDIFLDKFEFKSLWNSCIKKNTCRHIDTKQRGGTNERVTIMHPEKEEIVKQLEMYRLIFNSIFNGAIVTDSDGYVTHFNKPYGQYLGLDPESQIGTVLYRSR